MGSGRTEPSSRSGELAELPPPWCDSDPGIVTNPGELAELTPLWRGRADYPAAVHRLLIALALLLVACPTTPTTDDTDGDGTPDDLDCGPLAPTIHPGANDDYGDQIDSDCDGMDGVDVDNDGYPSNVADNLAYRDLQDCDDNDPGVNPGASEVLGDGIDQDCDGVDGTDADGDGYGSVLTGGLDCDDENPSTHPGATDPVGDGVDRNCDGIDGEDADRDGVASPESGGTDCDDEDPGVFPGAPEFCDGIDTNCLVDPSEVDDDGDGWLICEGDCDDGDPTRNPGATELCDGIDQDCDGSADTADGDGDGLRNCDGDCDDSDPLVYPGAPERCNLADDNCDGALAATELDADGDGHVACLGDCDDADPNAYPGAWGDAPGGADLDCGGTAGNDGLPAASVVLEGTVPGDVFGRSVCSADVDGDGLADLLIGAPTAGQVGGGTSTEGRIYLFLGSQLTAPGLASSFAPEDAWTVIVGEASFDGAGTSIANAGDLGSDGSDDIIIGAPGHDGAGQNAGRVYVVSGLALAAGGTLSLASSSRRWDGGPGEEAGRSVASGGDVNGSGKADILIGAPGRTANGAWSGGAYLVSGTSLGPVGVSSLSSTAAWILNGEVEGDFAGEAVAVGGDVDGDGRADLMVSAPIADGAAQGSGRVYLVSGGGLGGSGSRNLGSGDRVFEGGTAELAGDAVAFAGDVDGDLLDDLLIGSVSADRTSLWTAVTLPSSGSSPLASAPIQFTGTQGLGAAGADVDGDGLADVLIGGPGSGDAGVVWLFLGDDLGPVGSFSGSQASYSWAGATSGHLAGITVGSAGDTNGDGYDDLLVGSASPGSSASAGDAWLLRSPW